jgi:hypothetical protein
MLTENIEDLSDLESNLSGFETPDKAVRWYQKNMRSLGLSTMTSKQALQSGIGEFVTTLRTGEMYMFFYDPKMKEQLPYYDMAPLVIMHKKMADGFYGMNLHYISPMNRYYLLSRLEQFLTDDTYTETTRFRMSWSLLSRIPYTDVCMKRYLFNNVRSRFLRIDPVHWTKSIMLPVDKFINVSKQKLYAASRRTR